MLRAARKCGRFAAIWNSGLKFWGICKAQAVDIFGSTLLGSGRKHKSCTTILPGENKSRRFTPETLLRRRKPDYRVERIRLNTQPQ
jgi:hypothetical protein